MIGGKIYQKLIIKHSRRSVRSSSHPAVVNAMRKEVFLMKILDDHHFYKETVHLNEFLVDLDHSSIQFADCLDRRLMAVMEEDLQRLWQLLAELSSQLTQNREQCEHLKKQADDLKTQAIHTGTGYALKRFNVDLSQEQFESEVERMNAQLVVENQTLQHENRQLTILLKDYETTLEQIMTRFRNHAHSTQQHELDLTRYYESLLLSLIEKHQNSNPSKVYNDSTQPAEMDPHAFQVIQNISILIQRAMRELSGEEPYLNETDELESQQAELAGSPVVSWTSQPNGDLSHQSLTNHPFAQNSAEPFALTFQDPFTSNIDKSKAEGLQRRNSLSVIDFHPRLRDPSKGGYVGKRTGSLSDHALLSAIESERLRRENDYLREILGIANDFTVQPTTRSSAEVIGQQSSLSSPPMYGSNSHLAKLNSVVSEVIKEEEAEDQEEGKSVKDEENTNFDNLPSTGQQVTGILKQANEGARPQEGWTPSQNNSDAGPSIENQHLETNLHN
ncbi:hypothetical protein O181_004114 [Austropuccinia psidii MF-1]|uniref:Uncharacterized protein n=1 Tax=Austropuccinia psidii MF-1 TaxID=1389203 RepID=A0A9Q3BF88_9BASI|nr:hypothetical protein [Austropuccinia psidii MF-1]